MVLNGLKKAVYVIQKDMIFEGKPDSDFFIAISWHSLCSMGLLSLQLVILTANSNGAILVPGNIFYAIMLANSYLIASSFVVAIVARIISVLIWLDL